jgi:hypothetical protein
MTAAISGTRNGATWPPVGGEIDLPDDEAADMIRNVLAQLVPETVAEPADEPEAPEEAAVIEEPTERATKPKTVTRAKFRGKK